MLNTYLLSRTLKSETQSFEHYAKELEAIRYRNSRWGAYTSRLHYFSEWIYDNVENGLVETPTDQFIIYPNQLGFMSEHPDAYKHLANNPSYVEQIQQIEQELSDVTPTSQRKNMRRWKLSRKGI